MERDNEEGRTARFGFGALAMTVMVCCFLMTKCEEKAIDKGIRVSAFTRGLTGTEKTRPPEEEGTDQ